MSVNFALRFCLSQTGLVAMYVASKLPVPYVIFHLHSFHCLEYPVLVCTVPILGQSHRWKLLVLS